MCKSWTAPVTTRAVLLEWDTFSRFRMERSHRSLYLSAMLVSMDAQRLRVGLPIERFDPLDDLWSTRTLILHDHDKWRLCGHWSCVPGLPTSSTTFA